MITEIKIDGRHKPKMKILIQNGIFIGGRTNPVGLPDKSVKPCWNPVREAEQVRCPKPDT
jgi:hypothetical protein